MTRLSFDVVRSIRASVARLFALLIVPATTTSTSMAAAASRESANSLAVEEAAQSGRHSFVFSYGSPDAMVKKMPLSIRSVPNHKDDDHFANEGPIVRDSYKTLGTLSLEYSYHMKVGSRVSVTAGLDWMLYPASNADIQIRNYTNDVGTDTRGEGAALTYVGIEKRGLIPAMEDSYVDIFSNFTPKAGFEVALGEKNGIVLGTSVSYYKLWAVNGWDRYNSYELKDRYLFAEVVPVSVYVRKGRWLAGAKFNGAKKLTDIGKVADTQINAVSFFVSVGVFRR